MNAILSIKPKYVKQILEGAKRFEFRKQPLPKAIRRVYIYSSAPEKRIVGYFDMSRVFEDTPRNLWSRFNKKGGISSEEFFEYYEGRSVGYAFSLSKLVVLERPVDPYRKIRDFSPPQAFAYLRESDIRGKSSGLH